MPDFLSVGTPASGTAIHISDTQFTRLLPDGQNGEVCVSGQQIARG